MPPQPPTIAPILPTPRRTGPRGMGAIRRMGCHQPTAALDAERAEVPPHKTTTPIRRITPLPLPRAEVLGNIKALL